jgi:hypothetical protein
MELLSVNIPLARVIVGRRLPELKVKGKLLDSDATFMWIYRRKDLVGWTYSFNPNTPLLKRFKQLIAGTGAPCANVRIACNTHIKCYIDRKSMLIGSFNLTGPSILDLCIEVTDPSLVATMRIQFRKHWNLLK